MNSMKPVRSSAQSCSTTTTADAVSLGAVELEDRPFHDVLKKWRAEAVAAVNAATGEDEKQKVREHLFR